MFDTLPRAKKKAIRRTVEKMLAKYRVYKFSSYEEHEAIVTARYEQREGGRNNKIINQTAEAAIHNVDERERRRVFVERIERAVNELPTKEALLIRERYMCKDYDYITDYHVYTQDFDPPITDKTFGKIRDRAMAKLAFMLGIIDERGEVIGEREAI
jgi:ArpU family phage transcriptional regulator